jgi:2-hydroxy-6-oxonona-2,4-dienedioate hydrolase
MDELVRRDREFSWIEHGDGPPLMPIYGLLGGPSNFSGVVSHFKSSYRVVIPILPMADAMPADANVDGLVRFLARFLDALDLNDVNVIGSSLGGQLALFLAGAAPRRIRTVTLSGSAGLGENLGPLSLLRGDRSPSRQDYDLIRTIALHTVHDPKHVTTEMVDGIYQMLNHEPDKIRNLIAIVQSSRRRDVGEVATRITQPACLIWGRDDVITPPATAERFLRAIPHATLLWIEQCGHAPMLEQPETFNRLLEQWLKEN